MVAFGCREIGNGTKSKQRRRIEVFTRDGESAAPLRSVRRRLARIGATGGGVELAR